MFFGIFWRKSINNPALIIAAAYALASFAVNFVISITSTRNTFLYEALTFVEYGLFALLLYKLLRNGKMKKTLIILSILFTVFYILYLVLVDRKARIDSIPIGIETLIVLIASFFFLYEQTNDTTTLFIYSRPAFWLVIGIIIYLAGSFFVYLFANYLTRTEMQKFWTITNVVSILKNIFFCIAIYLNAKPTKENFNYNLDLSRLN